jgi:hypothetical protein
MVILTLVDEEACVPLQYGGLNYNGGSGICTSFVSFSNQHELDLQVYKFFKWFAIVYALKMKFKITLLIIILSLLSKTN